MTLLYSGTRQNENKDCGAFQIDWVPAYLPQKKNIHIFSLIQITTTGNSFNYLSHQVISKTLLIKTQTNYLHNFIFFDSYGIILVKSIIY